MKLISKRLLSACSLLAATATLNAAPFVFNDGDLILGFQASSGTGTVKNVFFNLGSATTVRDNPNPGVLGTIGTTLTAQFGANWYNRSDVHFGVIGNLRGNANSGFGSAPVVNGDPSRTFYLSTATESPSAGTLIPAATYPGSSLGAAATNLSGMETMIITLEAEANGSAVLDQTTQSVEWNNGWSFWNLVPGAGFGVFTGGIQQSFGKGTPTTAVDIQRVLSTNTGAIPAGVIGGGTYVTTVSVNSNGRISVNTPPANPEIAVEQIPNVDFPDGDTQGFGSVSLGSFVDTTFTIKNTGGANLTGLTITKDGTHDSDFTVTVDPVAPVIGGGSTTFTVRFAPTAAGIRTAAIHIASNDANEDPFDIALTGTGIAPEIVVEQPVDSNIADNGSRDYGNVVVGTNENLTFTIKNTGAADLTGLTTMIDGADASDFTVTADPVAPVESGQSTTFTVRFSPSSAGPKTAAIHIANNDANEDPFDITLNGTGTAPEISVAQPSTTDIPDNGSKSFGNVIVGSDSSLTFTIKNTGDANLTGLAITTSGTNAADFTITSAPVAPLAANGNTTFTVKFAPTSIGVKTARIQIANNDSDEDPFDITLSGRGIAPEIAVEQPLLTNIPDNGRKAFGSVLVGSEKDLTFTIKNTGDANLTGLAITTSGTNAADFTIITPPVAPVAANGSTTFTVRFAPTSIGAKTARIQIANNDSNEDPFDITLTGSGIGPEIAVEQPLLTNIPDNGRKAFGSVVVGTGTDLTFTIKNTGTSNLTGLAITTTGTHAADFTIITPPVAPVIPSGNTTFTVRFAPATIGAKTARIQIANNDSNEDPFDITLTGTGIAPEIAVEQPLLTNIPDNGTKLFGNVVVGSDKSLTFTIKNTGTSNLTGLAITTSGTNAADFTITTAPVAPVIPGGNTTFVVRFAPSSIGLRTAKIQIANNDSNESPFDITLSGRGTAAAAAPAPAPAASGSTNTASKPISPVTSASSDTFKTLSTVNPVDGLKYKTLVITKAPGTAGQRRVVEVSSDLMNWYSGKNHTTVLENNSAILMVRDNTPFSSESKRYIRLKASQP